jgi:hypothetical protein
MYKILTGIIARRISLYLKEHGILPTEQKGCHSGSKGCKDQLLVSKAIFEDCKKRRKTLNLAWIDYQKAFDSVPRNWIEKSIEMVGVNDIIVKFCKLTMEKWNTVLRLKTDQEIMQLRPIKINRGIFQGDSLLPLLFCIALITLTHEINRAECGYKVCGTERKISHLLHMDDLKLIARSGEELGIEINIVKTISNDIKMEFGLEKCARVSLKRGKVHRKKYIGSTKENEIKELDLMKTYKCLGVEENHNIEHKKEKERLVKEYMRRLRLILNTQLSARNKMQAIGSLTTPVLRYSFGINWHQEEIKNLVRKTRKMLTIHGQHHLKADIDRLYVPRKEGGRGLMQIEGAYIAKVMKLMEYVESKEDPLIEIVRMHNHNTNLTLLQAVRNSKKSFQSEKKQIKDITAQNIKYKWERKRMHG